MQYLTWIYTQVNNETLLLFNRYSSSDIYLLYIQNICALFQISRLVLSPLPLYDCTVIHGCYCVRREARLKFSGLRVLYNSGATVCLLIRYSGERFIYISNLPPRCLREKQLSLGFALSIPLFLLYFRGSTH